MPNAANAANTMPPTPGQGQGSEPFVGGSKRKSKTHKKHNHKTHKKYNKRTRK
jgi:hypothetical protein